MIDILESDLTHYYTELGHQIFLGETDKAENTKAVIKYIENLKSRLQEK
jgi:hypothetical protein